MYTYTALADEGGIDLREYRAVLSWLQRMEGLQGFKPVVRSPARP